MLRRSRALALIALGIALGLATGAGSGTYSAFSKTTANDSNLVTAKRIFPGTAPARTTSTWSISDAADGSAASTSDGIGAADAVVRPTSKFTNAFVASHWVSFDFMGGLPADVPVTGVTFDFNYMPNAGGDTGYFYFEVVKTSNGTVLGTHGSSASPISPNASGTTPTAYSVSLPEITSTNQLNDVTIKVYGRESGGNAFKIDLVRIGGSFSYGGSFGLFAKTSVDQADGSASSASPWGVWGAASQDAVNYQSQGAWPNAFSGSNYIQVTFPTDVPSGATITSVSFTNKFRSNGGAPKQDCFYYEAWSGGTLLQTYGSTASPFCSDTVGNWYTSPVDMSAAVNTAARVNGLVIKMFGRDSGSVKSNHDQIALTVDYYLD